MRDVTSGRDIDGPVERNQWDATAQWDPDGDSFYYLQLRDLPPDAPPSEAYRGIRIARHRVGEDPSADVLAFNATAVGESNALFPGLQIEALSGLAFGHLNTGIDRYLATWMTPLADLRRGTPTWRPLFSFADSVVAIAPHGKDLYVLTEKGESRVLRTRIDEPGLAAAKTVMLAGEERSLSTTL